MHVEVLMVANGAAVENGLLAVAGGGWETYSPALFPATLRGSVAGIVTLSEDELGESHVLSFSVTDSGGHVDSSSGSTIISGIQQKTVPGAPIRAPFDIPFSTVVRDSTVVNVGVSEGTAELAAVTFAVLDPIP